MSGVAIIERDVPLASVREKLLNGERLDVDDGLALFATDDLLGLGELADRARRLRGGTDEVFFVDDLALGAGDGLLPRAVEAHAHHAFTELEIVGASQDGVDGCVALIRSLHEALPDVHLRCFTATTVSDLARTAQTSERALLQRLISNGLGSLCGDGPTASTDAWLQVHREAHSLGMATRCALGYGDGASDGERVELLLRVRALQDESGGFLAIAPQQRPHGGAVPTTGHDDVRMLAISRLLLDNVPNVEADRATMSDPLAQVALHLGASGIGGGGTGEGVAALVHAIRETGRVPVQRDACYHAVRRFDEAPA